ncbi:hypothetical protein PECL_1678 [Pediococcus claussenii ATCC BAA-344]|uniref:Resolvase/invertase-type recombinase catalytic domain-containing protein n=1 Tax=Pediococcus claussenii (strain ATCC BAA-344 / DSM 14800 / JCM 18046 / KCTC 3811 / LMG 21948 / P06) TaxID=701521 RepID=G8PBA6_PEDCP|nr:hypothetical protein PECL_1678 [Pediococcus claussenii ATCC BAA-344]
MTRYRFVFVIEDTTGHLIFTIFGAFAKFERDIIVTITQ